MCNSQHDSGSQPYQTLSSNQEEACDDDGPQNAGREDAALSNHNAVEPPSSKSVKPLGRKGIERKNFSKQVVDELQAWFYNNISHP